ncbi:DUF2076 domain-containing protein [Candidatus Kirkpatrickella diaphorinae]|uniref:DUF2076 domain-containing protein n=1 Tax=Candidatus Kirkpatrickella diaphorinae TaxID=2984322 RepID=A0ABY6GJT6_9PROT|nr:DUF2076 domain-containing protein [Candidatus Kirkpatrickella diaphorinae]UYH51539.1 DUF2076 domain-containing protein [Candidatus Kirkpatrickella diaphorinae]
MNQQERDLIAQFVARVGGEQNNAQPGTALAPIDPEADQWIKENFSKHPEAAYRVTQMAVVQEAALAEAHNRIRQLQFQLQQAQQQPQRGASGGFFSNLFGGNRAQQNASSPPPGWGAPQGAPGPYPQQPAPNPGFGPQGGYPPNYSTGMFPARGTGFLGSALTTATGVAGGMLAANALSSLFSSHHFGVDPTAGGLAGGAATGNFGEMGQDPFAGSGIDAGNDYDVNQWGHGDNNPSWGGDDAGWGGDDGGGFDDSF